MKMKLSDFNTSSTRIYLYSIIFFAVFLCIYLISPEPEKVMHVQQGYLELPDADIGIVPLAGDWQFKWEEFKLSDWENSEYSYVPDRWENGPFGYASYRMVIGGLVPGESYAFRVPYMATAYSLFMDNEKVASNGRIGRDREESQPGYLPEVVQFSPSGDTVELVLMVSNFHHRRGGAFQTIYIGRAPDIIQSAYWNVFSDSAFVLVFISMSLSQIAFFLLRKEKANLLLALLFFTIAMKGLTGTSEVLIFRYASGLSWKLYEKINYLISFSIPIWVVLLVENLYGGF
jgi:hypothetical protein